MEFRADIILLIIVLITIFEWLNIKVFSRFTEGIVRLPVYCFETSVILNIAYKYLDFKPVGDFSLFDSGIGLQYWFLHIFLVWLILNLIIGLIRFTFIRNLSVFLEVSFYNSIIFPLFLLWYKFPDFTYSFSSSITFHQGLPCACAQCPHNIYKIFYFFRIRDCIFELALFMFVMIGTVLLTDWLDVITGFEKKVIVKDPQTKNSMIRTAVFYFLLIIMNVSVLLFEYIIVMIIGSNGYLWSASMTFCIYLTILVFYFNSWNKDVRDVFQVIFR